MSARHPASAGATAPDAAASGFTVDVPCGAPSAEELAALVAVVTETYAAESAQATAEEPVRRTAWSLSQRAMRSPLDRDRGWARFS